MKLFKSLKRAFSGKWRKTQPEIEVPPESIYKSSRLIIVCDTNTQIISTEDELTNAVTEVSDSDRNDDDNNNLSAMSTVVRENESQVGDSDRNEDNNNLSTMRTVVRENESDDEICCNSFVEDVGSEPLSVAGKTEEVSKFPASRANFRKDDFERSCLSNHRTTIAGTDGFVNEMVNFLESKNRNSSSKVRELVRYFQRMIDHRHQQQCVVSMIDEKIGLQHAESVAKFYQRIRQFRRDGVDVWRIVNNYAARMSRTEEIVIPQQLLKSGDTVSKI